MAKRDTTGPQNRGWGSNGDSHPITKIPSSLNPGLTRRRLFGFAGATFASLALTRFGIEQATKRRILVADGVADDADALNAWGRGERVLLPDGTAATKVLAGLRLHASRTVALNVSDLSLRDCRVSMPASTTAMFHIGGRARHVSIIGCVFGRSS